VKGTSELKLDRVLSFIQLNPGCYLRLIKRHLGVSIGTVQYHINRLEKLNLICSSKQGFYKCYYLAEVFQDFDKTILQILIQERIREILLFILEKRSPTQIEIVRKIGISPSSVNWHLQRLISARVIVELRNGRYKRYEIIDDIYNTHRRRILSLMKECYPSIWGSWSNGFT
jgi:predicted transcriptional regulator